MPKKKALITGITGQDVNKKLKNKGTGELFYFKFKFEY